MREEALGEAGNIEFEEQIYVGGRAARLWINGYYFHSDLDKYEYLGKLLSQNWPHIQMRFGTFVLSATGVIIYPVLWASTPEGTTCSSPNLRRAWWADSRRLRFNVGSERSHATVPAWRC